MSPDEMPRSSMKKVLVAFDVDGTLRCNCTSTCQDLNMRVFQLLLGFEHMKNTKIIIWSGGGADYAKRFCQQFLAFGSLKVSYHSKTEYKQLNVDIAIDDIQECNLGLLNLIVREK